MTNRRTILPRSIAGRMTFWFLLIALVPCIIAVVAMYFVIRHAVEDNMQAHMSYLMKDRLDQIETWIEHGRREAILISESPSIQHAYGELARLRERRAPRAEEPGPTEAPPLPAPTDPLATLKTAIDSFGNSLGYPNVLAFDAQGVLLYQTNSGFRLSGDIDQGPLRASGLATAVNEAIARRRVAVAPVQRYPEGSDQQFQFLLATPVQNAEQLLGVIAIRLDNADFERIFENFEGLGQTGDVYAGQLDGKQVVMVAPMRNDPKGEYRERAYAMGGLEATAVQNAVGKQSGFGPSLDYRGVPSVSRWAYEPTLRIGVVVEKERQEAYRWINTFGWVSLVILFLTGLIVIPFATYVARSLSEPLTQVMSLAQRVSEGDLTADVENPYSGEAGKLLDAVRNMSGHLRGLIGHIQQSIVTLMSTATEFAATSREQQATMQEYGKSTVQVATAVNEISATSQSLVRTMREVNDSANHATELAASGQDSLGMMQQAMTHLADSTGSISGRLAVISERASNINLVVTSIAKVSDHANLLSINAAIEAEKAGEYGRGYLVVAREIRRLADQAATASLDIERIVKEMQQSVSAGVMEMDKFNDQVRSSVGDFARVSDQIAQVIRTVQVLLPRFDLVNEGMAAQSQGADQIRDAMSQLAEGASSSTDSLRDFNKATEQLREAVLRLKDDISKFTT